MLLLFGNFGFIVFLYFLVLC